MNTQCFYTHAEFRFQDFANDDPSIDFVRLPLLLSLEAQIVPTTCSSPTCPIVIEKYQRQVRRLALHMSLAK